MNVFVIEYDSKGHIGWVESAQSHDNLRVVKMTLEVSQLLCTAINLLPGDVVSPYKTAYKNHPCAKWARESKSNFDNLALHGLALADEYSRRFGKVHKSQSVIEACIRLSSEVEFPQMEATPPAMAITDKSLIDSDPVASYRRYWATKPRIRYPKNKIPVWFPELRGNIPYEVV